MFRSLRIKILFFFIIFILPVFGGISFADENDFNDISFADSNDFIIDGTFEAALDIPRILFILKREPNGPPLEYIGGSDDPWDDIWDDIFGDIFGFDDLLDLGDFDWGDLGDDFDFTDDDLNWAYLDTGVSSIMLSKETATYMGIELDPNGQYVDPGVSGEEHFDISESLYIGVADYDDPNPEDISHYMLNGPYRFMVRQDFVEDDFFSEPFDLLGMPVMFGKTVVFNTRAPSLLEYFTARIKEPNDPTIPDIDFEVPIRFEKYVMPNDPRQVPPLPVLAYNPVIDNIIVVDGNNSSLGTFLFDTGAQISLISVEQAVNLGLFDPNGFPIQNPDFSMPVGGIGDEGAVEILGYKIDHLIVPTLQGYNLVYNNASIGVQDVSIVDENTGELITLDGVFGSNFIIATMEIETWDLADTPFDNVVLDTRRAVLGFDVNDLYILPPSRPTCGDINNPWPVGDLNRDCIVDMLDMQLLTDQWLSECDWLNWNCSGADLNFDGTVNNIDLGMLLIKEESY